MALFFGVRSGRVRLNGTRATEERSIELTGDVPAGGCRWCGNAALREAPSAVPVSLRLSAGVAAPLTGGLIGAGGSNEGLLSSSSSPGAASDGGAHSRLGNCCTAPLDTARLAGW